MKEVVGTFTLTLIAVSLGSCLILVSCSGTNSSNRTVAASPPSQTSGSPDLQRQRKQTEQQARPEVEQQRNETEQNAKSSLDKDAVAAVEQTQKAVDAISAGKTDEALAAIEQATGKINVLLARNPANGLVPLDSEVDVIDTAPQDTHAILEIAQDASVALDAKNYPTARALLYGLMSEIRVRI